MLIAAQYSGAAVKVVSHFELGKTNKSPEFLTKFPLGKVSVYACPCLLRVLMYMCKYIQAHAHVYIGHIQCHVYKCILACVCFMICHDNNNNIMVMLFPVRCRHLRLLMDTPSLKVMLLPTMVRAALHKRIQSTNTCTYTLRYTWDTTV